MDVAGACAAAAAEAGAAPLHRRISHVTPAAAAMASPPEPAVVAPAPRAPSPLLGCAFGPKSPASPFLSYAEPGSLSAYPAGTRSWQARRLVPS